MTCLAACSAGAPGATLHKGNMYSVVLVVSRFLLLSLSYQSLGFQSLLCVLFYFSLFCLSLCIMSLCHVNHDHFFFYRETLSSVMPLRNEASVRREKDHGLGE